MTFSVSDFCGPVLQISFSLSHLSHFLPHYNKIYLQWRTATYDPETCFQVRNFFGILWALLFNTTLEMCKNHAECFCTSQRPFLLGNFSSFHSSLKPVLTAILRVSLQAVDTSAEVGSAQQSVVVCLNWQPENCPRSYLGDSTEDTTDQQATHWC